MQRVLKMCSQPGDGNNSAKPRRSKKPAPPPPEPRNERVVIRPIRQGRPDSIAAVIQMGPAELRELLAAELLGVGRKRTYLDHAQGEE